MPPIALALTFAAAELASTFSITAGELERTTPIQLAARMLPAERAGRVVDGIVRRQITPWQSFGVGFWERPEPAGPMLCHRQSYSTLLMERGYAGRHEPDTVLDAQEIHSFDEFAATYPERATAGNCGRTTGYFGTPPHLRDETVAALNRLVGAVSRAASEEPLPFAVSCTSDVANDPVCADARVALARLAFPDLVELRFDADWPGRERSAAHPRSPSFLFGMSTTDGRSSFVTLLSDQERMTEVRIRRSWVIYH